MRFLMILMGLLMLPVMAAEDPLQSTAGSVESASIQASEWMSSAAFDEYRITQNNNLRFPESIEGRSHDGVLQYRALFKAFLPRMNYYYSHWGLTDDWYAEVLEKHAAEGYQLHSHTVFANESGANIHQATWIMTGELPMLGWETLIIPLLIWLAIPAYFGIQIYTLNNYAGVWRFSAILPAIGFIAAIGWTVLGFTQMPNLAALPLLSFSPVALVWLLVVMVLRSLILKQKDEMVA